MEQVSFCTFGDGDGYVTSVWLWREKCGKRDAETITVYLWTTSLYEKYASYIQEQLPDINIEFVVGNNNLDFYRFLDENGGLPDIITCCRFSLHDASPLKDSLMDLSTTNAAGAVYDTYLNSFRNQGWQCKLASCVCRCPWLCSEQRPF